MYVWWEADLWRLQNTGKQRKNKAKEVRGTHGKKVSKDKK